MTDFQPVDSRSNGLEGRLAFAHGKLRLNRQKQSAESLVDFRSGFSSRDWTRGRWWRNNAVGSGSFDSVVS